METNSFSQVLLDLDQLQAELKALANATREEIATCKALATPEEVNACYDLLSSEFNLMKDDVLNRFTELFELGNSALEISEDKFYQFIAGNREFVRIGSQIARSELVRCIQSM